jgi:hypothetical protein
MFEPFNYSVRGKPIPADVLKVLKALDEIFPDALLVSDLNDQGANFSVRGLTHDTVIKKMMSKKAEIFGPGVSPTGSCVLGPGDFQILSPLSDQSTGLTLRYLPNTPNAADYLSGFWYY